MNSTATGTTHSRLGRHTCKSYFRAVPKQCGNAVLIPSAGNVPGNEPGDFTEEEYGKPVPPRQGRPSSTTFRPSDSGETGGSGQAKRSPKVGKGNEKGSRKIAGLPVWGCIVAACSIGLVSIVLCLGAVVWFAREQPPVLSDPAVRPLVDQAVEELQAKAAALDGVINFQESSWLLDQQSGTISFDRKNGLHAAAPVQIIGTYNTADGTWLWAWDNPSLDKRLARDSEVVREYGRKHKIAPLTTRKLACRESDCWEFTALACKLCNAQGAYRGPAEATRVFMTFGKVTMSKKSPK